MSGTPPIQNAPEQRYLRRGANLRVRKVQRVRWVLRVVLVLLFHGAVVSALLLSADNTLSYLTRTREFAIHRVSLTGVERASQEAILDGLASYRGRNLLDVDLAAIESEVEQDPWVLRATVRRSLPDALEVGVVERQPAALAVIGERVHLIDATGYVIGPTGVAAADDLPVLTGLDGLEGDRLRETLRRGVRALGDLARTSPDFVRDLSELDLSRPDRVAAHLTEGGPEILLDPRRVERNLPAYLELHDAIVRRVASAEYVDLRWRDRISVMPAKPTEQGGSR